MAARLNTKFLLILVAVVVVVVGVGGFLAYTVLNKTGEDYVKMAQKAEAEGDIEAAARLWERAVGHEPGNVQWLKSWRDVFVKTVPETQQEAKEGWGTIKAIYNALAQVQQDDPQAQEDYLSLLYRSFLRLGSNPQSWAYLSTEADNALKYLPDPKARNPEPDPEAERAYCKVLRYRAISYVRQMRSAELDSQVKTRTREELERCLAAIPDDEDSANALSEWYELQSKYLRDTEHRILDSQDMWDKSIKVLRDFCDKNPDNLRVTNRLAQMLIPDASQKAQRVRSEEEARALMQKASKEVEEYLARAEKVALKITKPDDLVAFAWDGGMLVRFDRKNGVNRALKVIDHGLEAHPDNSLLLLTKARLLRKAGRYDEAVDTLQKVVDLPTPGMGMQSLSLFVERTRAIVQQADTEFEHFRRTDDKEQAAKILAKAEHYRDEYVKVSPSPEEDANVWWLDGQLAHAKGNYSEAIRLLQKVRGKQGIGAGQATVMYLLADSLEKRGQLGDAEQILANLFEEMPNYDDLWLPVWTKLISIQERLGMGSEACDTLEKIINIYSSSSEIVKQLKIKHQEIAKRFNVKDRIGKYQVASTDPARDVVIEVDRLSKVGKLDEAEKLLLDTAAKYPDDWRLQFTLARLYQKKGDNDKALSYYQKALEMDPGNERIQLSIKFLQGASPLDLAIQKVNDSKDLTEVQKAVQRWQIYRDAGDQEKALAELNKARQLDPEDPSVVEAVFVLAIMDEDWDTARAQIEIARKKNLDQANGALYEARLQYMKGNAHDAVTILTDALDSNSFLTDAYRLRGQAYQKLGDIKSAIADYERALESQPNDIVIIKMLADALMQRNENTKALELVRKAREFNKNDQGLIDLWVKLETMVGDKDAVRKYYNDLYNQNPDSPVIAQRYARMLIEHKDFDAAKTIIDKLMAEHGDDIETVKLAADWWGSQGGAENLQKGHKVLTDYIASLDPAKMTSAPYLTLGTYLMRNGQFSAAIDAYEKAIKYQDPKRLEAYRLLGDAFFSHGDFKESAQYYAKVADAAPSPTDPSVRPVTLRLIETLLNAGDVDGAEKRLESLRITGEKQSVEYYLLQAGIYGVKGDVAGARKALDQAVATEPNNFLTYYRRAEFNANDKAMANDAMKDLNRCLEIKPDYLPALYLKIKMLYNSGDVAGALDLEGKLLSFSPDDDQLRLRHYKNLAAAGRNEEALQVLVEGMERTPDSSRWAVELGIFLTKTGDFAKGRKYMKLAYEKSNHNPNIGMLYADVLTRGRTGTDPELAMHLLDRHSKDLEKFPNYYNVRARVLTYLHRYDEARETIIKGWKLTFDDKHKQIYGVVDRWFNSVRGLYGKDLDKINALVQDATGGDIPPNLGLAIGRHITSRVPEQADKAVPYLKPIYEDTNQTMDMRLSSGLLLASAYYHMADYESAVNVYKHILDMLPEIAADGSDPYPSTRRECLNNTAYLLSEELNKAAEAIPYAKKAAELDPDNVNVMDTLGWVEYLAGDIESAKTDIIKSIDIQETPANLLHMARILLTDKDLSNAALYLKRARLIIPADDTDLLNEADRIGKDLEQAGAGG